MDEVVLPVLRHQLGCASCRRRDRRWPAHVPEAARRGPTEPFTRALHRRGQAGPRGQGPQPRKSARRLTTAKPALSGRDPGPPWAGYCFLARHDRHVCRAGEGTWYTRQPGGRLWVECWPDDARPVRPQQDDLPGLYLLHLEIGDLRALRRSHRLCPVNPRKEHAPDATIDQYAGQSWKHGRCTRGYLCRRVWPPVRRK